APLGDQEMAQFVDEDHQAQADGDLENRRQAFAVELEKQKNRQGSQEPQVRPVLAEPGPRALVGLGGGGHAVVLSAVVVFQRATSCRAQRSAAVSSVNVG